MVKRKSKTVLSLAITLLLVFLLARKMLGGSTPAEVASEPARAAPPPAVVIPERVPEQEPEDLVYSAEEEYARLLGSNPVVIFSKSYCPHSKLAKDILLQKFRLSPAPMVVELDKHANGRELQQYMAEKTGRRTVPNVILNGQSVGGGDSISQLASSGELAGVFRRGGLVVEQ